MNVYDPVTGEIENSELLEDELDFEIESFNRQVIPENFNRAVLTEIARDDDSDFDFYLVVTNETKNIADLTASAYKAIRSVRTRSVDIVIGTESRILLWHYREQLEILPEQWLSTQGLRMDVLILKKDPSVKIDYDITRIFREHNILEYKRNDDELTVDVFAKVMAYAHLYKSQGKKNDAIPYNEISATIYRHAYPREAFKKLKELGAVIEEKYPGVYYVKGDYPFFPVQVLVGRKLNPKDYAMFRVLIPGAEDEDIRTFKNIAVQNREEAYQRSVDAVFQASVSTNRETYARLRKEDPDMYEALKDLMKDDFIATEARGERNKIAEQVRKKIVKNKSFEQIVDECESTPEEIRPIYTRLLAEFQN